MTSFQIRQCTNPECRLRLPIDPSLFKGAFCLRCGAPMHCAVDGFENDTNCGAGVKIKTRISVILDNIRSALNVGSIFRTADAVGIEKVYLCGITPTPSENDALKKTALGAEETIPWKYQTNALEVARELQNNGSMILSLECTPKSIPIHHFQKNILSRSLTLVLGNEKSGVDPGILEMCDQIFSIPMLGRKQSLNVAVAFAIAVYQLNF